MPFARPAPPAHPAILLTHPRPTTIYPLSLHDALPIYLEGERGERRGVVGRARLLARLLLALDVDEAGDGRDVERARSEEHTSELQSQFHLVCRLLLEKKNMVEQDRLIVERLRRVLAVI